MKKITELTQEQKDAIPAHVDKWIKVGLCTDESDWETSKKGIEACYRYAGLEPPKTYVKVDNPMVLAIAAPLAMYLLNSKEARYAIDNVVEESVGVSIGIATRGMDSFETDRMKVYDGLLVETNEAIISVDNGIENTICDAVGIEFSYNINKELDGIIDSSIKRVVGNTMFMDVDDAILSPIGAAIHHAVSTSIACILRGDNDTELSIMSKIDSIRRSIEDNIFFSIKGVIHKHDHFGLVFPVNEAILTLDGSVADAVKESLLKIIQDSVKYNINDSSFSSVRKNVKKSVDNAIDATVYNQADAEIYYLIADEIKKAFSEGFISSLMFMDVDDEILSPIDVAIHHAVSTYIACMLRGDNDTALSIRKQTDTIRRSIEDNIFSSIKGVIHDRGHFGLAFPVDNVVIDKVQDQISNIVSKEVSKNIVNSIYMDPMIPSKKSILDIVEKKVLYTGLHSSISEVIEKAFSDGFIRNNWYKYLGGQMWSGWQAYVDFFLNVCGLEIPLKEHAMAYMDAQKSSFWWYPTTDFVMVCNRPKHIHMEDGRLHHPTRLAVEFRDGWGIAAWRGTVVPNDWILGEKPTANELLAWENVEQRRAGFEIIGWDKLLTELNAVSIDKDENPQIGELLEIDLPGSGKEKFLKVVCGTGREFVLPVDPECKTAYEANCWTYGLPPQRELLLGIRT